MNKCDKNPDDMCLCSTCYCCGIERGKAEMLERIRKLDDEFAFESASNGSVWGYDAIQEAFQEHFPELSASGEEKVKQ